MKLGIVGVGAVGAATAIAVVLRGQVRELVLVDNNRASEGKSAVWLRRMLTGTALPECRLCELQN